MTPWSRRLLSLVTIVIFGIALWVLHRELQGYSFRDFLAAIRSLPPSAVLEAILLTIASYATLVLLEAIGFRMVGSSLPLRRIAISSFIGFSFANTVGMPLFSGIPIRYRLYSAAGVVSGDIVRVIAFTSAGFWSGVVGLAGVVLALEPEALPMAQGMSPEFVRVGGALLFLLSIGYLLLCALRRRHIRLWRWRLDLPKPRLVAGQMLLAWLDWGLAAGVLYVLLPSHHGLTYAGFVGVFLVAQIGGLISQVPGGVGVVESLMVVQLSSTVSAATVIGALLVYRAIYFIAPFMIAASLLGLLEIRSTVRR